MKKHLIYACLLSCVISFSSCGLGTQSTTTQDSTDLSGLANIGSIIGAITGTSSTVVGSWTYEQPAIELESENVLAQLGGKLAAQQLQNKVAPYYQKIGIKKGSMTLTFNNDGSYTGAIGGRKISGNYTYDKSTHKLHIVFAGRNISLPGYCSVSGSQLNLTFPANEILTALQHFSAKSTDSSLNTLSSIMSNYNGVNVGFSFVK